MKRRRERCARCGELGEDRRTLWMACLYEMAETGVPFKRRTLWQADMADLTRARSPTELDLPVGEDGLATRKIALRAGTVHCKGELTPFAFYTLRVCKNCRGDWLDAIRAWFGARSEPR